MPPTLPRVPSIRSRLTSAENGLRDRLLDRIVEAGTPLDLIPGTADADALGPLFDKGVVARDQDGRLAFAYPVSATSTRHRVTLGDGRAFHAMCAVDALGAAFTFRQPARITSSCSRCGAPVAASVGPDGAWRATPDDLRVLHVDLSRRADWAATS